MGNCCCGVEGASFSDAKSLSRKYPTEAAELGVASSSFSLPYLASAPPTGVSSSNTSRRISHKDEETGVVTENAVLTIPFFEDLDPRHFKHVKHLFQRKPYDANEVIVPRSSATPGDVKRYWHWIVQGNVGMYTTGAGLCNRSGASGSDGDDEKKDVSVFPATAAATGGKTAVGEKDRDTGGGRLFLQLGQGEFFGDLTLSSEEEHMDDNVEIRALEDMTIVLRMDAHEFKAKKEEMPDLNISINFSTFEGRPVNKKLKEMPFLSHIAEDTLLLLTRMFQVKKIPGGQYLWRRGDDGDGLWIVLQGQVEVTIPKDNKMQGTASDSSVSVEGSMLAEDTDVFLSSVGAGGWLGEIALLNNIMRTASCKSAVDGFFLFLSRDRWKAFTELVPEIVENFQSVVSIRTGSSLKSLPLFNGLQTKRVGALVKYDEKRLAQLGELFTFVQKEKGEIIVKEGSEATALYIIVVGECAVTTVVDDDDDEAGNMGDAKAKKEAEDKSKASSSNAIVSDAGGGYCSSVSTISTLDCRAGVKISNGGDDDDDDDIMIVGGLQHTFLQKMRKPKKFKLDVLTSNQWFGEAALGAFDVDEEVSANGGGKGDASVVAAEDIVRHHRCSYTVIANTKCLLLRLSYVHFRNFLQIHPEARKIFTMMLTARTADRMKKIPFFSNVKENKPWSKLDVLGSLFQFENFGEDEEVYREGALGDSFYLVISGSLSVSVAHQDSTNHLVDVLKPNDWFGEIALLRQVPRTETVKTLEKCVLLSITTKKFQTFLKVAPELTDHFTTTINSKTSSLLRIFPLFRYLEENRTYNKIDVIAQLFEYRSYSPGAVIFREGEQPTAFFFICKGTVAKHYSQAGPAAVAGCKNNDLDTGTKKRAERKDWDQEQKQEQEEGDEKQQQRQQEQGQEQQHEQLLQQEDPVGSGKGNEPANGNTNPTHASHSYRQALRLLQRSQFFGHVAIFTKTAHAFTAICDTDLIMLVCTDASLSKICTIAPELEGAMLDDIRRNDEDVPPGVDIDSLDVTARVAKNRQRTRAKTQALIHRAAMAAAAAGAEAGVSSGGAFASSLAAMANENVQKHRKSLIGYNASTGGDYANLALRRTRAGSVILPGEQTESRLFNRKRISSTLSTSGNNSGSGGGSNPRMTESENAGVKSLPLDLDEFHANASITKGQMQSLTMSLDIDVSRDSALVAGDVVVGLLPPSDGGEVGTEMLPSPHALSRQNSPQFNFSLPLSMDSESIALDASSAADGTDINTKKERGRGGKPE